MAVFIDYDSVGVTHYADLQFIKFLPATVLQYNKN